MAARSRVAVLAARLWTFLPDRLKQPLWVFRWGAPPQRQWLREVMNRDAERFFSALDLSAMDVVEVSGGIRSGLPWRSYTRLDFPEFDLCDPNGEVPGRYDLVVCEQVLEHVEDPITAVRTLRQLCRSDGMLLVSTPFLLRLHGHPGDYWRFTPDGLRKLLESNGFSVDSLRSWGNRRVVRGNLGRWLPYRRWRSLKNESDFPIVVWAFAKPR